MRYSNNRRPRRRYSEAGRLIRARALSENKREMESWLKKKIKYYEQDGDDIERRDAEEIYEEFYYTFDYLFDKFASGKSYEDPNDVWDDFVVRKNRIPYEASELAGVIDD